MSIEPGTLWNAVRARTRHALGCGALRPIEIETRVVQQEGIPFLVRVATNLRRKDAARAEQAESSRAAGKTVDPFQPYEEDLFVTDLPPSHFCLLNKYNVIDHHLLIITRDYADQEELITPEDFAALWACLAEIDGVGLYNGGKTAGASQPHKHLQGRCTDSDRARVQADPVWQRSHAQRSAAVSPRLRPARSFTHPHSCHGGGRNVPALSRDARRDGYQGCRCWRRDPAVRRVQPAPHPPLAAAGAAIDRIFRRHFDQRTQLRRLDVRAQ